MRVLHVVKTSDGAAWAAAQAAVLVRHGIEVHVAVPRAQGRTIPLWRQAGAYVHVANLDLPARRPWAVPRMCALARSLIREIGPDLIHSHFVSTALLLRLALTRRHTLPLVFQVPGPLHLEHIAFRNADVQTAGPNDFWVGSSRYIVQKYLAMGIDPARVFLSYYGVVRPGARRPRSGYLRAVLGIAESTRIVGNINFIYPPKRFLGHRVGLKCHEDVIDALGIVVKSRRDVMGVLIGTTFGTADTRYEERLRTRAQNVGRGKIVMPGFFGASQVEQSWPDFDCAVHVPLSENCGGVIEPLLAGVPTIASTVGGLPEVIVPGETGALVPARNPEALARAIQTVLDDPVSCRQMTANGRRQVTSMFDTERTGAEIIEIYRHLTEGTPRPLEFRPRYGGHDVAGENESCGRLVGSR